MKLAYNFSEKKGIYFFFSRRGFKKNSENFYTWMQICGHNKTDPITVVTLTAHHTQTHVMVVRGIKLDFLKTISYCAERSHIN